MGDIRFIKSSESPMEQPADSQLTKEEWGKLDLKQTNPVTVSYVERQVSFLVRIQGISGDRKFLSQLEGLMAKSKVFELAQSIYYHWGGALEFEIVWADFMTPELVAEEADKLRDQLVYKPED